MEVGQPGKRMKQNLLLEIVKVCWHVVAMAIGCARIYVCAVAAVKSYDHQSSCQSRDLVQEEGLVWR